MRSLIHDRFKGNVFMTATMIGLIFVVVGLAGSRLVVLKMRPLRWVSDFLNGWGSIFTDIIAIGCPDSLL